MTKLKREDSIMVTIRNRKTGESKSFTVYDTTVNKLYNELLTLLKRNVK